MLSANFCRWLSCSPITGATTVQPESLLRRSDYVEGLISKMRNTHKDLPPPPPPPPPSFAAETAQASLGRRLQRALTGGPDRKFSGPHSPPGGAASPSLPLNRRLSFPIITLLAALAVGLLFLLPGGPLQAQDDGPIKYAENGTGAVATLHGDGPGGRVHHLVVGRRRRHGRLLHRERGAALQEFPRL